MNLRRYADNHTVNFLKFVIGLRKPETSVSAVEQQLLRDLARNKSCIVEVGVFEGATSHVLCSEMHPEGKIYLVDPFFPEVRLERLFNVSFTRRVATAAVQPWRSKVEFVTEKSAVAASRLPLQGKADLIFIDARHDYASVLEDFNCWQPMLASGGTMAFHDSCTCVARPDLTDDDGPVRLMREIAAAKHGAWEVTARADSVTAIRRKPVG